MKNENKRKNKEEGIKNNVAPPDKTMTIIGWMPEFIMTLRHQKYQ